jgi:hypothetical protein
MPHRARASSPLGRRTLTGIAIGETAPPADSVEPATYRVLDRGPFLPPDVSSSPVGADYYLAGPGAALSPPRCRRTRSVAPCVPDDARGGVE